MSRNALILLLLIVSGLGLYAYQTHTAKQETMAQSNAPLVKVAIPELNASETQGKALYTQYCSSCHGANAAGQDNIAPSLVHKIYEPSHHGDQAFYLAALQGVRAHHWPFGNMPPVEGITEEEISPIIAYIRRLQRHNGIE